jgi:hypothetical protein
MKECFSQLAIEICEEKVTQLVLLNFYSEPPRGSEFFLLSVAVKNLPESQGRR